VIITCELLLLLPQQRQQQQQQQEDEVDVGVGDLPPHDATAALLLLGSIMFVVAVVHPAPPIVQLKRPPEDFYIE
jgi:hypothetical protein